MKHRLKHYKFTMHDVAIDPSGLLYGGQDYSIIKTWAHIDTDLALDRVEQYATYYGGHIGAHTTLDITHIHQRKLDEQMEITINET